MYATLHCHKELAHILIDTYKFDAKWSDDFQITLLHDATDNDCDTEFMKILTSNGADVNARDENGETPLQMAVRRNRDVAVKALIELGADLEKVDTKNRTPLNYALKKGHSKVAKLLSAAINTKKSEKPGANAHKDATAVGAHDKVSHAKAAPVQPPAGSKH
ncbi:ankyrin repeats (3 copies) domain-containing protein [Ditylenchus destructor]|nr:ankyrin repeats (3 copies) domain-containing protein [Ditylenchus destructor]